MPKRKQNTLSPQAAKFIGFIILILVLGWLAVESVAHFFTSSDYFKIKTVLLDPSLDFINKEDVEKLKGTSIFSVDLKHHQQRMNQKYPQVLQLRFERHFPDQIHVIAKARVPIAQIQVSKKVITFDDNALVVSTNTGRDEKFPLLTGIAAESAKFSIGEAINTKEIRLAIQIIKVFRENASLKEFSITQLDMTNLSSVEMKISNGLMVLVDRENLAMKMNNLGILLSRADFIVDEIKYVDLRFKEPIIGKKEQPTKKK